MNVGPDAGQNGEMAHETPGTSHPDSFGARSVLSVGTVTMRSLPQGRALSATHDVQRLPYSIKVLLENLVAPRGFSHVSPDDIVAVAAWGANPEAHGQGAVMPRMRSPSLPNASSCRTSPVCPAWSTWLPCAMPWPASPATRPR